MAKVPESFNFGSTTDMSMEELVVKLQRMYFDLARALNKKPDVYFRAVDGQTDDTFLSNGDVNVNTITNKVEMLTEHPTQTTVTWVTLG